MKWFIALLFIVGLYYGALVVSTNMVLDQTAQLQYTYQHVDQIASRAAFDSH